MAGEASYPDVSPLVGMIADEICVSMQLRLDFHSGVLNDLPPTYVAFTRCRFVDRGDREHDVDIERDPESAGPVLSVVHHKVAVASVEKWKLRLEFDNGSRLLCAPDSDYEAWEMFSPHLETLVFCPVGGE
jgi:Family of unknown function (DUF6188)